MTTEQLNTHIEDELTKLSVMASDHIKILAMNVLKSNSRKCTEFVMAMGTFFFSHKGEVLYNHEAESLKGYTELDDFVSEWLDLFIECYKTLVESERKLNITAS